MKRDFFELESFDEINVTPLLDLALLDIPAEQQVVALLPIGVPAESPDARARKALSELYRVPKMISPAPSPSRSKMAGEE